MFSTSSRFIFIMLLTSIVMLKANMLAMAQENERRIVNFNVDNTWLAVQGYDVVSYFMGQPRKGKAVFEIKYEGINYRFYNKENLELFKKQPNKFEPVYGGWCAFAMGESGNKVKIDPKTYKIIDGKLYLFYNFYFNNTLIDWSKDEKDLKIKADTNWSKIID